jgi:PAS domain S-box-containing protein
MNPLDSATAAARPPRDARLAAINFVSDAVNRTLDLKDIADNALRAVLSVMNLDAGAVYLWKENEQALRLFASSGLSDAVVRQVGSLPKGVFPMLDAALEGATTVDEGFTVPPELFGEDVMRAGFRSAVLSPVRTQGVVVGLLVLGTKTSRRFAQDDTELIAVIANQIGNALVHAQLQAEVRASEEQYRSLVENSDDAIFIAGPDCRPRFANAAFARVFGFSAQELAGLDPYQRIHPDDAPSVRRAMDKLLHGESVRNLEYRFCHKDGRWIDLQCSASVFTREADRVKEIQFIVREVTQARRREQQLLRRNRELAALTLIAQVANSSLKIEEIARDTLRTALETTGMDAGAIHLADEARRHLGLYVHTGLPGELAEQLRQVAWGEGVTGEVVATGRARILSETELPVALPSAAQRGFKVLVKVPVKAKDEILGTVGLLSKRDMQFTPELVETIKAMGNQLGIALANARLYETQLRENEQLSALLEISSGAAQRLELGSLLQQILRRSAALLRADGAYMVHCEPQASQAEIVAASALFENLLGARFNASEGLFGQVRATRQGRIFARAQVEQYDRSPPLLNANLRSVLVMPLISRDDLIGSLVLARQAGAASDFTAADLELMEAFANRAAMAIDNARLLEDLGRKNELLELLVDEAHHRIKNNLQMISGLLQLQAGEAGSDASAEQVRLAISRIQAIAQVHNLLSHEMVEQVDTHVLIAAVVKSLVDSVAPKNRAEFGLELEHLWLDADKAVAVALIVNELVTNALLHGQPPEAGPLRVQVQCSRRGDRVHLVIDDNGGGFRSHGDRREFAGQGMNIVNQLAQVNLRGTLQITAQQQGVRAELQFGIADHTTAAHAS